MKVVTREFLNDNAYRAYPIDVAATYEPYTDGDVGAVNSLLLDMRLTVPKDVAVGVFVSNITVTNALVTMTLMGVDSHPFIALPDTVEPNEYYTALGAYVIATVQVRKSVAVSGAPVPITPEVDGVSGLVVFGPGVQNNATWAFAGPASSLISTLAITRYDYAGLKTLGRTGFDTKLDGAVSLVGGGGVEVTASDNVVSIAFEGTSADIRNSLDAYRGQCGGRPETGTCSFTPIKTVNYLAPYSDPANVKKLVLLLDKPLHAYLVEDVLEVSSDLPIESFCSGRINIPDPECPAPAPTPNNLVATPPNTLTIPAGLRLVLDMVGDNYSASMVFEYVQQHPLRSTTGVFRALQPDNLWDEYITELHIDVALNEWQLYSRDAASLRFFGPVYSNFKGSKNVTIEGKPYIVRLGRVNNLEALGYTTIELRVEGIEEYEEAGVYTRRTSGEYVYGVYKILVSSQPSTWSLYKSNRLVAAGPLSDQATSVQVQNYSAADGTPAMKTYILIGS